MSDFEEAYSLLFTGVVVMLLFLIIYHMVNNYWNGLLSALSINSLIAGFHNYSSPLLDCESLDDKILLADLDNDKYYGTFSNNSSIGLPAIIFCNNVMNAGRVIIHG